MRVALRPSTADDFMTIEGRLPAHRTIALTAVAGEQVLGIGGLVFAADGRIYASASISDEGRRYPRAVHRAGLALMQLARKRGLRRVYAEAEAGRAGADRWLLALGFRRLTDDLFVWEAA